VHDVNAILRPGQDLGEAIAAHELLDLRKEVLGPKHPDTIRAMGDLALTWQQQGRSNEAEKLQVEVLDLRKEVLGLKHPDTIRAMANLAVTWQQQGWSNEAEKLEVDVLDLRKEVLGLKHPDTILSMAWRQQGRSNKAENLEVEVLLRPNYMAEPYPQLRNLLEEVEKCRRLRGMLKELAVTISDRRERANQKGLDAVLNSLEYMPSMQLLLLGSSDHEVIMKATEEVVTAFDFLTCCNVAMENIIKFTKESIQPLTSEPQTLSSIWRPELDMETLAQMYEELVKTLKREINSLERIIDGAQYLEWRSGLLPVANLRDILGMPVVEGGDNSS